MGMGIASSRGHAAEALAAAYLELTGYEVVGRNVRIAGVEVDLVARDRGFRVLVEVKYRGRADYGGAALAVHRGQQARLLRAAGAMSRGSLPVRVDVVAVQLTPDGARIDHHRNAVTESRRSWP
jgi:putative endonuclease